MRRLRWCKPKVKCRSRVWLRRRHAIYLCRWPNGDFSIVAAENRSDAVSQLDEWGAARPSYLTRIDTCLIDFRLNDDGDIELEDFGDDTADTIFRRCYPVLDEVLSSEAVLQGDAEESGTAASAIRSAVEHERRRLCPHQRRK